MITASGSTPLICIALLQSIESGELVSALFDFAVGPHIDTTGAGSWEGSTALQDKQEECTCSTCFSSRVFQHCEKLQRSTNDRYRAL